MPLPGRRAGSAASTGDYLLLAAAVTALVVVIVLALGRHAYRVHDDPCAQPRPALGVCE